MQGTPEDAYKDTQNATRQTPQRVLEVVGRFKVTALDFTPLMLPEALGQSLSLSPVKPVGPWPRFPPQRSGCHPLPGIRLQGRWGRSCPSHPVELASAGLPWGPRTSV